MAAQSTLKACASCKGNFTSYTQHSPAIVMPRETPFRSLTNLALCLDRAPQSSKLYVASKTSSDGTSISTILNPLIQTRTPSSTLGADIASVSVRTPICSLPTELMILIFQYACNDIEYWLTALSLSLVSRDWRSIAQALPELWTHIVVDVPTVKRTGSWTPWRTFEVVWWYLHLAGAGAPLHVKLDLIAIDGDREFERAVGLLVQETARWERADIKCASEDLCKINAAGTPMFQSLKFYVDDGVWDGKRCKAFRNAPRLGEYAPGGVSPRECVVPWDKLKTVILTDFFDCDLYECLRDASAMRELVINEACFFEAAFGRGISIPLMASTVTMKAIPRLMHTFMEAFMFPFLTSVDISIADGSSVDSRFIPSFIGMLKRSGCSLKELTLHNLPLDDEAVLDILGCTPQLRALTIHEPAKEHCITNAFLRDLVLPELRRLELVWSFDTCEERVMDMVERMKGLESVVLGRRFGEELCERTVERMNVLRNRGVSVGLW